MKRILVLIFILTAWFSESTASAQCSGFCGGFAGSCWCDDFCWIAGDCCPDMCASCPGQGPNTIASCPPPPPPPPPPCGTPVTFNYSGGLQNYTVPAGITTLTIVAEGAQGGGVGGTSGGLGTILQFTVTVVPGQVIQMDIGGQGGCPGAGYNGGGIGYNSTDGFAAYGSCGGGGATEVSIGGSLVAVAAGGGGAGGGSDAFNNGGAGGCANGSSGVNTFGAGGTGGTQTSGGIGGAPWAGTPPGGQNGSLFQGGNGGLWQTASGGGGGGGYFGGGGGGNDGCCTGANGGGGGGGGSSLTPAGGNCSPGTNTGNGSVTIYVPLPNTMTSPNTASICSGGTVNIPLTSTLAGSTFTWVATANPNVTGESTTTQTTSTLNNTLVNTTTAVQIVTYTVTLFTGGGTCPGTPQTVNVTVNPPPVITPEPDLVFCAGAAVPLNSFVTTPAGSTFTWTNSNTAIGLGASGTVNVPGFTATNATTAAITATITVTPSLGGCPGTPDVYTITVNPLPVITPEPDQTFCAGDAVPVNTIVSTPPGATFNWTNSNTTIGLGASGTGNIPAFTATNATTAAVTSTVTITPVLAGCTGVADVYIITVNPLPVITPEADQVFCAGAAVPLNGFVSTPPGATFNWTNSNTAVGLGASGTGSVPAFTATNATTAAITSNVTVTPVLAGCTGVADVYTITVNPSPVVVAEPDLTFCAGDAVPLNSFVSVPPGATFAWTNTNTAIGLAANGTGSVPAFTATNATAAAITGTITVTPTLAGCPGTPEVYTITVNPLPVITPEPDQVFCAGAAVPLNGIVSTPPGATFNWTNSNTAIGLGASGTGSVSAFTATNATAAAITSTVTVTPVLAGCTGTADVYTITVNPSPAIVAEPDLTFCAGDAVPLNSFVSVPPGATFAWTNSNTAIGLGAGGAGSVPAFTATNATAAAITGTITVTPTAAGCPGTPDVYTITVNPLPVITAEPDQTYCAGNAVPLNGFVSTPPGATFNWTNSNTAVGLAAPSGTGNVPAFTATNGTGAAITSNITVTPVLAGCTGTADVYVITVNPLPVVNDPADQTLCANTMTTAVNFTGTAGATFNWTNTTTSIGLAGSGTGNIAAFNAINAGTTPVTATITVTPTLAGCTGTPQTFTITVNPIPTVGAGADQTVCQGTAVTLTANNPMGAGISWNNGVTNGVPFTPAVGSVTYTVTATLAGCTNTDQVIVTVNPNPAITVAGTSPTTCAGTNGSITISGLAPSTLYNVTYNNGSVVGPAPFTSNGAGVITITGLGAGTYSGFVVSIGSCSSTSATVVTLIDPAAPTVTDPADQTLCANTMTTAVNFTGTAGATFNWTNNTPSIGLAASGSGNIAAFNALNAGTTPVIATITVTPSLTGCTGTPQTFTITVNPIPTVTDPADQSLCAGAMTTAVNFAGTAGATFNWTNSTPAIGLAASGSGNIASFAAQNPTAGTTLTATITVTPTLAGCNGTPQTFTIAVVHTAPTLTPPANLTAICSITEQPPYANFAAFTGAGGSASSTGGTIVAASFTLVSQVSNGLTCPETVTRTYSIQDNCGNTATCVQTITVDDNINPTGTAPAAISVQCIGNVPVPNTTLITDEADNCAVPVVTFISDVSNGLTCPETITRTYRITDACGNFIDVTQTITVDDTTNPTASNPGTITIPGGPAPAPDPLVVTDEADNCSVPVVVFVSDVSDGNLCPETITRTYSVTDACGNQILVTQQILITDPIMPTATSPAAVNVECIGDVPVADPTIITDEADNNGLPVVAFVSDVSDGNTCPETITRTYSVTDPCGNQILVTQQIIVDDITAPTASNPAMVTVQCIGDVPAQNTAVVADEADNCTAVPVVAFVSDVSDGNTCPETITRTYSITDDCGNVTNVTQTIVVDDTTNPTASNPVGVTVECIGDVPAPNAAVVTDEADNCSVPVVAHMSDVSDGNTCPETITRTYSVTDACGNVTLVTQTIIVNDITDPTASNPVGVTVDIIANVPAPDPLVVTDEADNCSVPVVAFVSDVSDGNTCPETITRTYSVTDACGNAINVTQTIIVNDMTNPTASNPAAVNVQCTSQIPVANPAAVIDEADNNGVPTVTFVSDVSDGNTCPEVITRTYSVTDPCGNQIFVTQTITVNDITPPTAANPAGIAVQCIGQVPAPNITVVVGEADNCTAAPVVAFVNDVNNGATCPTIITRTYSVTDDCGNVTNVTQTITVDDTTNPTATAPATVTVQCIAQVPAANTAVITDEADNCAATPLVLHVGDVSDGNTCPEIITRTYSITDDCNNQITVTQTIIVNDITNPTASNPPAINVTCASSVPAPNIAVVTDEADNCSVPVVAFVSDVSDGNVCNNETITRTYSVTDACGNQITVTQQIIIGVQTPIVDAGTNQAVCDGTAVTLTASNPNGAVLAWDNAVTNTTAFMPAVGTLTYTVTATQCGGECVATDQVDVTVNPMPAVAFTADPLIGCDPLTVMFFNQTSPAGSNCVWNFGDGHSGMGCDSVPNTYLNAGVYDVTLTVTSLEGCTASTTYTDYVTVEPNPEAGFTFSPTEVSVDNPVVQFTNTSQFSDSYVWDFGDATGSLQESPEHTFPGVGNVTYNVMLIASNFAGCADTVIVPVEVQDVIIFYVPNVFTPDGNEINNTFQPVFTSGFDIYDYHLLIYNRWGEVMFESYNAAGGWDGTYGDQGLVEDGVYIWQIEFGDNRSDKRHKHRGHVTVLK